MTDTKLLPCPFCGSEAEVANGPGYMDVSCSNMGCPVGCDTGFLVGEEAVAVWNTRALTPKQKAAEEMAEALLDMILDMDHAGKTSPAKRKADRALAAYREAI